MRTLAAVTLIVLFAGGGLARAADEPSKKSKKPADAAKRYAGPEIRWARSWREACDEAAERNVLIFLHSHGST